MTAGCPGPVDGIAAANVYALSVGLGALQRLLDRRAADGALVQAEPALIDETFAAVRDEARRVRGLLAGSTFGPEDPLRGIAEALMDALDQADAVLDVLDEERRALGD